MQAKISMVGVHPMHPVMHQRYTCHERALCLSESFFYLFCNVKYFCVLCTDVGKVISLFFSFFFSLFLASFSRILSTKQCNIVTPFG